MNALVILALLLLGALGLPVWASAQTTVLNASIMDGKVELSLELGAPSGGKQEIVAIRAKNLTDRDALVGIAVTGKRVTFTIPKNTRTATRSALTAKTANFEDVTELSLRMN